MNKPAFLSGSDCVALGLIIIKADEIFSLTSAVKDSTGKRGPTYQTSSLQTSPDPGSPPIQTCNSKGNPYGDPTMPSPSCTLQTHNNTFQKLKDVNRIRFLADCMQNVQKQKPCSGPLG